MLAETPAAVGLGPSGNLYWGEVLLASDATSVAVRRSGAGGPFLLYTTRTHFLYTIPFSELGHTLQATSANVSNRYCLNTSANVSNRHCFNTAPSGQCSGPLHMAMKPLQKYQIEVR